MMINRAAILPLAFITALTLAACGGESDGSGTPDSEQSAEPELTQTSVDSQPETTSDTPTQAENDTDNTQNGLGDCSDVLTLEEIGSILVPPTEITGAGTFCNVTFASDSVGGLIAFTDKKADEAMDALLPKFKADAVASAEGVLLDEDRGFVHGHSAVVRGDSGRVFRFDAPDGIDVPDIQAAMEAIAALLLTR